MRFPAAQLQASVITLRRLNVFARRNKLPLKLQLRLREFARYQRVTRSLQVCCNCSVRTDGCNVMDTGHSPDDCLERVNMHCCRIDRICWNT